METASASDTLLARIRGRKSKWIRFALFALVTAGIFFLLFRRIGWAQVWETLRHADPWYFALAASFTIFFPTLAAFRWRRMLLALGYSIPWRDCLCMIMAAWPMGTITPSKSGDLIKAYYLKDRIPAALVLGSVLAERTMDVLVLLVLSVAGCVFYRRWFLAALSGGGLAAGLVAIALLLYARLPVPARLQGKTEPMLRTLRLLVLSPGLLVWVVVFTVLNWLASILQVVFAYRALGTRMPLLFTAGHLPLAIFVGLLPLTLSGMGRAIPPSSSSSGPSRPRTSRSAWG